MESQKSKNFTVCPPQAGMIVGILDIVVLGLFIIFSPLMWPNEPAKSRIVFYVVFGLGIVLGAYLLAKTLRFRIVVKNDKITVTPLLSKTYTFTFDDIETVKRQVKERYNGHAERIIICTKQGEKVIVDSAYVSYKKMVGTVIECVDKVKLIGEWEKYR